MSRASCPDGFVVDCSHERSLPALNFWLAQEPLQCLFEQYLGVSSFNGMHEECNAPEGNAGIQGEIQTLDATLALRMLVFEPRALKCICQIHEEQDLYSTYLAS